jgi:hypothetical protein
MKSSQGANASDPLWSSVVTCQEVCTSPPSGAGSDLHFSVEWTVGCCKAICKGLYAMSTPSELKLQWIPQKQASVAGHTGRRSCLCRLVWRLRSYSRQITKERNSNVLCDRPLRPVFAVHVLIFHGGITRYTDTNYISSPSFSPDFIASSTRGWS